jgi:hypothetical protein
MSIPRPGGDYVALGKKEHVLEGIYVPTKTIELYTLCALKYLYHFKWMTQHQLKQSAHLK